MNRVYGGTRYDVAGAVRTHLFGIAPNNSGSTFLKEALATCRATWNLLHEGQHMLGFAGPASSTRPPLIWSAEPEWLAPLADPGAFDWRRTRQAWYFQAFARTPEASVFYTKAPPFLVYADELARHFPNPKFLFMVRNPYAVCEGICRNHRRLSLARLARYDIPTAAARHVVNCFDYQRRHLETHRERGVFFTYEAMCDDPDAVEAKIRGLVPELDDLRLRQRLPVKYRDGKPRYDELLTNMNERQIARLDAAQVTAFNRVFRPRRELFEHFGYEILEPER